MLNITKIETLFCSFEQIELHQKSIIHPASTPIVIDVIKSIENILDKIVRPNLAIFVDNIAKDYFSKWTDINETTKHPNRHVTSQLKRLANKEGYPKLQCYSCTKNDQCIPNRYQCNFHRLPVYIRLSSVFALNENRSRIIDWNFTDLRAFILNCKIFTKNLQILTERIRYWSFYKHIDANFHNSFDIMMNLLTEIGCDDKIPLLADSRNRFKEFYPVKSSIEHIETTESRLKILTEDQWNFAKPLIDCNRFLLKHLIGSEKTLIAIKIVISRLIANRADSRRILLLSHSRASVSTVLLPGIDEELRVNLHNFVFLPSFIGTCIRLNRQNKIENELYVGTIDDLVFHIFGNINLLNIDRVVFFSALRLRKHDKFDLVIIDEGQHVFSHQPDRDLEGQHFIAADFVRDVVDSLLGSSSQLAVFHDDNCQTLTIPPVYPDDCEIVHKHINEIIQCSAQVRDVSETNRDSMLTSKAKNNQMPLYFDEKAYLDTIVNEQKRKWDESLNFELEEPKKFSSTTLKRCLTKNLIDVRMMQPILHIVDVMSKAKIVGSELFNLLIKMRCRDNVPLDLNQNLFKQCMMLETATEDILRCLKIWIIFTCNILMANFQ